MRHFYAVGNFGNGSQLLAFQSKKDRDYFVAWGRADNRRALTRQEAKKRDKQALLLDTSDMEQWVSLGE